MNGSVRLSSRVAERCAEIARRYGVAGPVRPIAFLTGGTDAGELARTGIEATTLMGMEWTNSQRNAAYHTPEDTVESVDPAAVEKAARIIVDYLHLVDAAAAGDNIPS